MNERNYPAEGTVFQLTMDADIITPIEMVRRAEYHTPDKWRYEGTPLTGIHTGYFTLVPLGFNLTIPTVKKDLAKHGAVPSGQWLEAYLQAYWKTDGLSAIGVADPQWFSPKGLYHIPYISRGMRGFYWVERERYGVWRWLVQVPEPRS
jgi:hypothetical protein